MGLMKPVSIFGSEEKQVSCHFLCLEYEKTCGSCKYAFFAYIYTMQCTQLGMIPLQNLSNVTEVINQNTLRKIAHALLLITTFSTILFKWQDWNGKICQHKAHLRNHHANLGALHSTLA